MPERIPHGARFTRKILTCLSLFCLPFLIASLLVSAVRAGAADSAKPGAETTNNKKEATAQLSKAFKGRLPITELTEEEAVLHALNRLGYGPRPGDIERIRQMGLEKWLDRQLHPESLDDAALAGRLERYPTLAMTSARLLDQYPRPEVAAKRMGITVEAYRKKLEEQAKLRATSGMRAPADMTPQQIVNELTTAKLTRAVYGERQLYEQLAAIVFV